MLSLLYQFSHHFSRILWKLGNSFSVWVFLRKNWINFFTTSHGFKSEIFHQLLHKFWTFSTTFLYWFLTDTELFCKTSRCLEKNWYILPPILYFSLLIISESRSIVHTFRIFPECCTMRSVELTITSTFP